MNDQFFPPNPNAQKAYGVHPVDFILDQVLTTGLDWFRTTVDSEKIVFNQLTKPWMSKYASKPAEFKAWVVKYELNIVQHFSKIAQDNPCLSIQILDAQEREDRSGLTDFAGTVDFFGTEGELEKRKEDKYCAISDSIHIGIHANQPDMAKYLYYLVIYLLNSYKPQLEEKGIQLGTFRASDLSMMNQYLPQDVYSRFVTFTVFSWALIDAGEVPLLDSITGIHMAPPGEEPLVDIQGEPMPTCEEDDVAAERVTETYGLHACDIRQESGDE